MIEQPLQYSARKLVLSLVKEAAEPMSSHILAGIGELFGIRANTIRVAITRLVSDDMLQLTDKGVYGLGKAARSLAQAQDRGRTNKPCSSSRKPQNPAARLRRRS